MVACPAGLIHCSPRAGKSRCLVLERPPFPSLSRVPVSMQACCTFWALMSVVALLILLGGCGVEKLLFAKGHFWVPLSSLKERLPKANGLSGLLNWRSLRSSEFCNVLEEKAEVLVEGTITTGKV